MYWDIIGLYPGEHTGLLASIFPMQFLYICSGTTLQKEPTTIPIDYKLDYTIPEIVTLLFSS